MENSTKNRLKEPISKREVVIVISQLIVFFMLGLIFLKFLIKDAHVFHNLNIFLAFFILYIIGGVYLVYRTAYKVHDFIFKARIKKEELELDEFTKEVNKRLLSGENFDMQDFGKPPKSITRQFIEAGLIFIGVLIIVWISYLMVYSKL